MQQRSVRVTKNYKKGRFTAAFFVLFFMLFGSCNRQSQVTYDPTEWRNGDLVLRSGYGLESRVVTERSQASYSHIGILFRDSAQHEWYVIHAVPGEDEPEYVKAEPLSLFFNPERACNGAWLRVRCSDEIAYKAACYALRKVKEHCLFDNNYLLADSSQLYCTELVWRAFRQQGVDITSGNRHAVPAFFCKEGECIFPSDIEQSKTTLFIKPLKTNSL